MRGGVILAANRDINDIFDPLLDAAVPVKRQFPNVTPPEEQSEEIVNVSVGGENDAVAHCLMLRQQRVEVRGHVRAESLGQGLKLLDQTIPPALRNATL